ncbi:MAG TPA: hypothetical protein VG866_00335 [Candidatus Paceibacterota bacterium]|nr:hypothetical protein [Candidatus Paceibacterota bacterium]
MAAGLFMIPNPYPGIFLAVEGIDGAGKTELIKALTARLQERFPEATVKTTKEPDRTGSYGRLIYKDLFDPQGLHVHYPKVFQGWYAADSKQNVRDRVIPFIASRTNFYVVISDRYRPSVVYGAADAADIRELMAMTEAVMGEHFIWPDAVFILDVTVDIALERLRRKNVKLDGFERRSKLSAISNLYHLFSQLYPFNCYSISADGSIENTLDLIWPTVETIVLHKKENPDLLLAPLG